MRDLPEFIAFVQEYLFRHLFHIGGRFEWLKSVLVGLLMTKRGKHTGSFLNTSLLILAASAIIAGPVLAQNNPFEKSEEIDTGSSSDNAEVIALDESDITLDTIRSDKGRDKIEGYTVAAGDTLDSISKKFGVSQDTLRWANDLDPDVRLKVGQIVKVLPVTGVAHVIRPGDTIYSVAKKYKVDPQAIANFIFNDFRDNSFGLVTGSTLIVPGGVIEEAGQDNTNAPVYAQIIAGVKGTSNFIWPTTGIITQYPSSYHMALDIANNAAPPVIAADTGTVVFAGCIVWGYGCHIIIDHGNGYRSLYGHLSVIGVSAGQAVNQGQQIGTMGSTGRSTGTHLHFEVRSGNSLLNPLGLLK